MLLFPLWKKQGGKLPLVKREGIVLNTRKFGEADKIVVIFSPQSGRFEGVAKGARKAKSKFGGRIEPFTQARFLLYEGRSIPIITQVEVLDTFKEFRENLELLGVGAEALKIVNDVSLPQREKELYFLLLSFLSKLRGRKDLKEPLLAAFEIKVLALLGYGLSLNFCAICSSEKKSEEAFFSFSKGGIICNFCLEEGEEVIFLPKTSTLIALLSSSFDDIPVLEREEAESTLSFLETCFNYYLEIEFFSLRKELGQ